MLKRLAQRTGILARLRMAWRQDVYDAAEPLRNEVRLLRRDLERLRADIDTIAARAASGDRTAAQVKATLLLDEQQRERVAMLATVLDERRIEAHVRAAIAVAPLHCDPYEHIVVEQLLPDDVYRLAADAIPPVTFFGERDPVKQDLPLPLEFGPMLATRVWNFMDAVVARHIIRPAVVTKFDASLQRHYDAIFGESHRSRASDMPQSAAGGRLMLRRPGYHLAPHRDPKRSLVTCLLYVARPGDCETYGTQIFRVLDDGEASYKQTYFPEEEGRRCELVKSVPFRANSMLAFLNSRGAHGASIPSDAPATLERYTYQFYIAPQAEALTALIKTLPPERRAMWANKSEAR